MPEFRGETDKLTKPGGSPEQLRDYLHLLANEYGAIDVLNSRTAGMMMVAIEGSLSTQESTPVFRFDAILIKVHVSEEDVKVGSNDGTTERPKNGYFYQHRNSSSTNRVFWDKANDGRQEELEEETSSDALAMFLFLLRLYEDINTLAIAELTTGNTDKHRSSQIYTYKFINLTNVFPRWGSSSCESDAERGTKKLRDKVRQTWGQRYDQ
ncbi:hypothetical protein BGX34_000358 [Mortierella sp. NVP85]|nr:hypothetical protein BGX34_000358 [Mortierella sp. NVP85]